MSLQLKLSLIEKSEKYYLKRAGDFTPESIDDDLTGLQGPPSTPSYSIDIGMVGDEDETY